MITDVNYQEFEKKIYEGKPVVAEFYSPTCIHCKRLEKVLQELEEEFGEQAVILRCNVAGEPSLAAQYDITSVPTILFIRDGEIKEKLVGEVHRLILAENIKKL